MNADSRNDSGSPLLPWGLAGAILVALAAAVCAVVLWGNVAAPQEFVAFNARRAQDFADSLDGTGGFVVVILGDSRIKYATADGKDLESRLAARLGQPVRVFRVVNNLAVFEDFLPLVESIDRMRPALVIVQDDLLQTGRPLRMSAELLRLNVLGRFLPGLPPLADDDQQTVQFEFPCWDRPKPPTAGGRGAEESHNRAGVVTLAMEKRLEAARGWVRVRPESASAAAARRFVLEQVARGARVAVLTVPATPEYEAFVRKSDGELRSRPVTAPAGAYRWAPPPQSRNMYCDLTHFTPTGSQHFIDWLVDRIAEMPEGPGPTAGAPAVESRFRP